jgi:hypothetical protein
VGHGDYARLSPEVIDRVWVRLRAGQAAKPTARELGLCAGTVRAYLLRCGGIRPAPRRRPPGRLRMADREEISRGLAAGRSIRAIASGLGRAPSTVSREVAANGGRRRYRAAPAGNTMLGDIVEEKLQRRWSPQQIAGWVEDDLSEQPGDAGVARASTAPCSCSRVVRCARS